MYKRQYLWIASGRSEFADPRLVGGWLAIIAFLLISSLPTLSWARMRPRRSVRLEVIAFAGLLIAALLTEPWLTLVAISVGYLLLIPVGLAVYAKVRRQRADRAPPAEDAAPR